MKTEEIRSVLIKNYRNFPTSLQSAHLHRTVKYLFKKVGQRLIGIDVFANLFSQGIQSDT